VTISRGNAGSALDFDPKGQYDEWGYCSQTRIGRFDSNPRRRAGAVRSGSKPNTLLSVLEPESDHKKQGR
jgi:hypothetical protein